LIDTNIVSKYLSGLLPVAWEGLLDLVVDSIPQLSVITQIELLSWRNGFETRVGEFVNDSIILALTPEVVGVCIIPISSDFILSSLKSIVNLYN
jgi:hypothetical protein